MKHLCPIAPFCRNDHCLYSKPHAYGAGCTEKCSKVISSDPVECVAMDRLPEESLIELGKQAL